MENERSYHDDDDNAAGDVEEEARLLATHRPSNNRWEDMENGSSLTACPRSSLWARMKPVSPGCLRRKGSSLSWRSAKPGSKPDRVATRRKQWRTRLCLYLPMTILSLFGIIHLVNFLIGFGPLVWDDGSDDLWPHWGEPGQPGEGLAAYPTDFTRDILPIPCHSHNDYWRRVPLYEAIHYGCTGVEADVWLIEDELYVGHSYGSLTSNRTFRSLYVDPIVDILDKQNPSTRFANVTHHGVFDTDPGQSLTLLVDFKTSGAALWPVVLQQLEALREKNYLTYFDGTTVIPGPVTVVATGNAPSELVLANSTHRDVFFDAPLSKLWEEPTEHKRLPEYRRTSPMSRPGIKEQSGNTVDVEADIDAYDATNSYYASTSFRFSIGFVWWGRLSKSQMNLIRGHIKGAHSRGLKARFWDTPSWPIGLRNYIWDTLVKEGADYLNVDDLRSASRIDWRKRAWHGSE